MVNYNISLKENLNLVDGVKASVTRNPAATGKVIIILFISGILFIFQHFLNRVFVMPQGEELNKNLIILICILLVPFILLLFSFEKILKKELCFLVIFLLFFLLTINLFVRFLESSEVNQIFLYFIISLVVTLILFKIAQHYPSINFFKPLADWFGIN